MAKTQADPKFYAELARAVALAPGAPVNTSALLRDKDLALQRAASLHSYQSFLTQARSWKATQKSVPRSFEREVQLHAAQALADGRELTGAALRSTRHLKQAGHLDHMLDSWIAGVKASGPVQVQDLWSDVADNPETRQTLRDQGLTDSLFAAIDEQLGQLDGQFALHGGKLATEVKLAGQERAHRFFLAPSASGPPRTLHDLIRRGQFEQFVQQSEQGGPLAFDLAAAPPRELEITEIISAGALAGVQSLAQHKRKLEDSGLATVAGSDPLAAAIIVGVIAYALGLLFTAAFCGRDEPPRNDLCTAGAIMTWLGLAVLLVIVFATDPGLDTFLLATFFALGTKAFRMDSSTPRPTA